MLALCCALQVFAALSIPSGYEKFVQCVRSRVVIHESDLRPRNSTPACKSISGPFCAATTKKRSLHNFSLVDSVVSLTLFPTEDLQTLASSALNDFLSKHDHVKMPRRADMVESRLWIRGFPTLHEHADSFSMGGPSMSLQGSWRVTSETTDGVRHQALTAQQVGRVRFEEPVLLTSLVVHGNVSVRGRLNKKERWRAESADANECKVGSMVLFLKSSDVVHVGTILFYAQDIVFLSHPRSGLAMTRSRSEIVGLHGQNCENIVDRPERAELVDRPTELVDEIFFFGDEEFGILEMQTSAPVLPKLAKLREPFLMVLPNYQMYEVEQSIFSSLLTVDDIEQRGLELDVKDFSVPPIESTDIKIAPGRQFDHIMLCMEENAISGMWQLPLRGPSVLAAELLILKDAIKAEMRKDKVLVHWELFFNHIIEVAGFDYVPTFVQKCPNHPVPPHWLKDAVFTGGYRCGRNPTELSLKITHVADATVVAEFSFKIGSKRGAYMVKGSITGRVLTLRPSPNGWLRKPDGFVSVGLVGVLRERLAGAISFEGSVLSLGCGPFSTATASSAIDDVDVGVKRTTSRVATTKRTRPSLKRRKADEGVSKLRAAQHPVGENDIERRCASSPNTIRCELLLLCAADLHAVRKQYISMSDDTGEDSLQKLAIELTRMNGDLVEKLKKILGKS